MATPHNEHFWNALDKYDDDQIAEFKEMADTVTVQQALSRRVASADFSHNAPPVWTGRFSLRMPTR